MAEAVVFLYPVVLSPHTLLAQIPEDTEWLTLLDLKDAFFCIPYTQPLNFCLPLKALDTRLLNWPGQSCPKASGQPSAGFVPGPWPI